MTYRMSQAEAFLCQGIRHLDRLAECKIQDLYWTIGDKDIYQAAMANGVVPNIAHALSQTVFKGKELPPHWRDAFESTRSRIQAYMDELDSVASALSVAGIKLVALKNSGITRAIYPQPGASPMGDMDVLVNRSDFLAAHGIMSNLGYRLKFRNPFEEDNIEQAFASGGAEYSKTLNSGHHLWFELQWRPIAGRWIQPDQEPTAEDLIRRAIPVPGSPILLLSPEDNLLQVCVHTAKHTFVRAPGFRLHTDVDRIVAGQKIDWNIFVARVKQLRVRTAVFMSLDMARELLDSPIPDGVLRQISPPTLKIRLMKAWLNRVGIFNPDTPKWTKIGYIIFVSLLFDGLNDFWRAIFPSSAAIQKANVGDRSGSLAMYYLKRLVRLATRRTGI